MSVIVGIDIGGSTTKICGFTDKRELIDPLFVKANDPLAALYGAFGKFTQQNNIPLSEIQKVMITGAGSTFLTTDIYGLQTKHVDEFGAIGLGGLYLSNLDRALVVSMGTGTAIVGITGNEYRYLGGTGVGGGTLSGLSKIILQMEKTEQISELATSGSLDMIDLRISDITKKNIIPSLLPDATAANFGNLSDIATKGDIALGIINLVFETIGMMSIFASRNYSTNDIVLVGNLTSLLQTEKKFKELSDMFSVNFIINKMAGFGTVIGAALSHFEKMNRQ